MPATCGGDEMAALPLTRSAAASGTGLAAPGRGGRLGSRTSGRLTARELQAQRPETAFLPRLALPPPLPGQRCRGGLASPLSLVFDD